MNSIKQKLAVIYKNQLLWLLKNDLATELASDASTCASDHDDLSLKTARKKLRVRNYRLASKQIFDIQILKISDSDASACQVDQARQRANANRQRL